MPEGAGFIIPLLLLAVGGVLVLGVLSMAKGGAFNRKYGNKLMQLRVALQFGVVLLILLLLVLGS